MKKIISLIICSILLCSLVTVSAVKAENTVSSEAVETLVALGILEGSNGDLMLEKAVTRAELVTMIVRALNVDVVSQTIYFDDVSINHWAAGSIAAACELGIVHGVSERIFEPDAPVIFEEAVKMLVSSLGYEAVAMKNGGYPYGYLITAQNIGLLKGINGKADLIIRRNMAAEMLFNALNCEIAVETGVGSNIELSTKKGVTLLSENMKIEKGEGIVTANEVTSLSEEGGVNKNRVKIGDKVFSVGSSGADKLLGFAVTYYADASGDDEIYELIYVRKDEKKNTMTKVFSENIMSETTETKLVYLTEEDKTKKINISIYADLIYNGVSIGGFGKEDIVPSYGYVELLDNDGDNEADVLFVYDFETIIAGNINPAKFTVYDYKDSLKYTELDPASDSYNYVIYENREIKQFSDISAGCVLSIAKSKNESGKRQVTVELSNNTVTGNVSSLGEDIVFINDVEYEVSNTELIAELKSYLGRDAMVYVDSFGRIAGIDKEIPSTYNYGYLIAYDTESKFNTKDIYFKILEASGEVSLLKCAKKISLDEETKKEPEFIISELSATKRESGSGIEQLIRYRKNLNGDITAIDTVGSGRGGEGDTLKMDVSSDTRWRHYAGGFGATGSVARVEFIVNSETLVFLIPGESQKDDNDKYAVSDKSYFSNSDYYYVEGYDMEDGCLGACVLQNTEDYAAKISTSVYPTIIEKITTVVNVKGEETYKIYGMYNGKEVEAVTLYKDVINDKNPDTGAYTGIVFKPGDIVRWATDADDNIIRIEPLLTDVSSDLSIGFTSVGSNLNRFYATFTCDYGYLIKKDGLFVVIGSEPEGEGTIRAFELESNIPCFVFDVEKSKAEVCTLDELNEHVYMCNANSRVAVIARNGSPNRVFIYKFD